MTRVYQALYAPPPRTELGPCPWVVCPLTFLHTKGCPRLDSTLRHSPLRHPCRVPHRRRVCATAPHFLAKGEVRPAPALCRRPGGSAGLTHPRDLAGWVLYPPQNRHASTAHCQHHRAKILTADCMPRFTYGKAKAQRVPVTCPESHNRAAGRVPS